MPNQMLINTQSATQSKVTICKQAILLAQTKGFYGVRVGTGLTAYGTSAGVDTSYVVSAAQYAYGKVSKVSFVLNIAPKPNGAQVIALNGGVELQVPTLPTATAVLDYVVQGWQDFVDAVNTAITAAGGTPSTFVEWEWLNEPTMDGNQAPKDKDGSYSTYPLATYPTGTIVPDFFTSLEYISSRVNFRGMPTISLTLENQGTSTATREVNSIVGTNAASVITRGDRIGFNCYGPEPASPYDAATYKALFSAKVQAEVARMTANPLIGSKTKVIREWGFDTRRKPPCTYANTIRDDMLEQLKTEAGIVEAAFYCPYDLSTTHDPNSVVDARFYAYDYTNSDAPLDGVSVAP